MEPESPLTPPESTSPLEPVTPIAPETRFILWVFLGKGGLRAGWSVAIFMLLCLLLSAPAFLLSPQRGVSSTGFTPANAVHDESLQLLPALAAFGVMLLIERRNWKAYFLGGSRRIWKSLSGAVIGFLAFSALLGALSLSHWITLGPSTMTASAVTRSALLWGLVFLMTAVFEEGSFRCYLLYTMARGFGSSERGFWIAALVTSALFGAVHLSNTGENQLGVFFAALIGFVLCVSVRVTGNAWWAIGFHAAWDWSETFFYGAIDSGMIAQGHLFSASPMGKVLWSGGSAGPEGSLLVLPVILLVLAFLLAVYWRSRGPLSLPESQRVTV
jgi:uncharacterized protein